MKGLLQSKRLRTNLIKWVTMYVCVMVLFTSVVTYSKYITRMNSDSRLEAAKFNVEIRFNSLCENEEEIPSASSNGTVSKVCNTEEYRPTSLIPYSFTVDSSELQVNNLFVLTLSIDPDFELVDFIDATTKTDIVKNTKVQTGDFEVETDTLATGEIIRVRLISDIVASQGGRTTYNVNVRYRKRSDGIYNGVDQSQVIKVGYSATQH